MTLPEFNTLGNLPEHIYKCDKIDIWNRCVDSFPDSAERHLIYDGFRKWHDKLTTLGISGTVWIDGSFTTRKFNPANPAEELEPGDIDVLTFMDYDQLNKLSPLAQNMLRSLVKGGEATKASYRSHTIFVPSCQPGHPYHPYFEKERKWYRDIFSRHSPPSTRTGNNISLDCPANGPRKGIIEITVGNPMMAPHIEGARH